MRRPTTYYLGTWQYSYLWCRGKSSLNIPLLASSFTGNNAILLYYIYSTYVYYIALLPIDLGDFRNVFIRITYNSTKVRNQDSDTFLLHSQCLALALCRLCVLSWKLKGRKGIWIFPRKISDIFFNLKTTAAFHLLICRMPYSHVLLTTFAVHTFAVSSNAVRFICRCTFPFSTNSVHDMIRSLISVHPLIRVHLDTCPQILLRTPF